MLLKPRESWKNTSRKLWSATRKVFSKRIDTVKNFLTFCLLAIVLFQPLFLPDLRAQEIAISYPGLTGESASLWMASDGGLFQRKRDRFKACLYGRGQAFYSKPAFRSYAVHVRRCSIGVYGCCRRGGRRLARLCEKRLAVCLRCVEGNQTLSRSERGNHRNISNRRPRR